MALQRKIETTETPDVRDLNALAEHVRLHRKPETCHSCNLGALVNSGRALIEQKRRALERGVSPSDLGVVFARLADEQAT